MANQNKSGSASSSGLKTPQVPPLPPTGPANTGRKLTPKQEAARRRAQKRRRVQILVTTILVLVVATALIAIGIAVSQPTNFVNIPAQVSTDERPSELGPADAKVTVEEFTDYQCPFCKSWHEGGEQNLINDYVKAGKSVKLVVRQKAFLDRDAAQKESHLTAEAAVCAGDQKRFWDFHGALYANQPKGENTGYWTTNRLKELAKSLKLNEGTFNSCLDSNKYRTKVNNDASDAVNRGITGTPTFVVNGNAPITSGSYADVQKATDEALNTPAK